MFIELYSTNLFSPVGTQCVWTCYWYLHIVPAELKRGGDSVFYKHIIPTGLKIMTEIFINLRTVCVPTSIVRYVFKTGLS